MVLTTLPLCPRKTPEKSTGESFLFRSIALGLIVLCLPLFSGCGSGGGGANDPIATDNQNTPSSGGGSGGTSFPSGSATASLAWNPVADPSVYGYYVHYGQQSPNSSGSCAYQQIAYTSSPSATITGLAPNTTYYFAVSATNGSLSTCSNEVSLQTAPA
jgi:fibronectin type III domain protein